MPLCFRDTVLLDKSPFLGRYFFSAHDTDDGLCLPEEHGTSVVVAILRLSAHGVHAARRSTRPRIKRATPVADAKKVAAPATPANIAERSAFPSNLNVRCSSTGQNRIGPSRVSRNS
jgi:hypothetical protein